MRSLQSAVPPILLLVGPRADEFAAGLDALTVSDFDHAAGTPAGATPLRPATQRLERDRALADALIDRVEVVARTPGWHADPLAVSIVDTAELLRLPLVDVTC